MWKLLSLLLISSSLVQMDNLNSLKELRWKHRIVLTSEPVKADIVDENKILDLRILYFSTNPKPSTNYSGKTSEKLWMECEQLLARESKVVLIGLDGGIKEVYDSLDWSQIFSDIDKMPMRRAELKRGNQD
jgi:hypothetical protein